MNLGEFSNLFRRNVKEHSPLILSTMAGVGTLGTTYLAIKATFQAAKLIDRYEELEGVSDDRKERFMDRTKLVWKLYIPTGTSAFGTIVCIVGANRLGTRKTMAAQAALTVTQQVYSDYRDKVIEEFGARKDQSIRDTLAEERVKNNPPKTDIVIASGNVLCCELFTGRYFSCDMETLRKSENLLNKKILTHDYATMDDFYYMIGIKPTTSSGEIGWNNSRIMELQFTSVLTEDGRPCLAFDYNYTTSL
jgi:Family of unknown function (DUF6353)